jgi:acyl-CoA thioester hydrolase
MPTPVNLRAPELKSAGEVTPLSPVYREEITALPEDIDELGHVSNVTYVRWVQDVARRHSAAVGLDLDAYERLGAVFVVHRHEIEYLQPALEGDRIALITFIATWQGATSDRHTFIERVADGIRLAQARTVWAYVRRSNGRPIRIPREVVETFKRDPYSGRRPPWSR